MTAPDYWTLLLYIAGIFVISTVSSKRTSSRKEMFSAGRQSPWWASGLSGFMTMFSASTFVVWGGIAYELGLVAVAINTCYGVAALLVGYWVAGKWNRLGVTTPAEFVSLRFGKTGLHFFTWTMMLKRILGVSVSLYSLALLLVTLMPLRQVTGEAMELPWAIILFGVIVVVYTMQGGLWAVLMTDVLQFIVLTVVVFLVAFLMLGEMGDWTTVQANVPEGFLSPVGGQYGWFFLFGWVTIHFFIIGAEWAFVQRFLAVKNEKDAKKSSYLFGIMYLVTPLFWLLPPLLFRGQGVEVDKEKAYILAAQSVLPPGVMGLMFAAMFSATASMVSSQLNVFAGVLTNDFYRPIYNPKASEKKLVFVGRAFTALIGVLLVGTAIFVPNMGGAEKVIISINNLLVVPLFAPALWGLFSKKIGVREMVIVALSSFAIGMVLRFGIATNPLIQKGDVLFETASYLAQNTKNLEVLVGVVLPIVMLCWFEWRNTKVDARATLVAERSQEEELQMDGEFDAFPARMVMTSVLVLGGWMMFLGVIQNEGRGVLLGFGSVMLFCGVGFYLLIRNKLR